MTQPEPGQSWAETCFRPRPGPPLTTEQLAMRSHINKLRFVNFILFYPFMICAVSAIVEYQSLYHRHRYDEILPGVLALIILGFVIRNKLIKARLKWKLRHQ
jgi:hypothetical protein